MERVKETDLKLVHEEQDKRDVLLKKYSVDDELEMLRLAPSNESSAYDAYVEECRAWGHAEKAKIGLGAL